MRSVDDMELCPGSGSKPHRRSVCPVCGHLFKYTTFTKVTPTHRRWKAENVETSCFLCEGSGRIHRGEDDHRPIKCPDCGGTGRTPENVEEPMPDPDRPSSRGREVMQNGEECNVERVAYDGESQWFCTECRHVHTGAQWDYICIGCPCDFVPVCERYPQVGDA